MLELICDVEREAALVAAVAAEGAREKAARPVMGQGGAIAQAVASAMQAMPSSGVGSAGHGDGEDVMLHVVWVVHHLRG